MQRLAGDIVSATRKPPALQAALFDATARELRSGVGAGIERAFDVPFVSQLALKEKQTQQNVRPIIAVHKWFARRPGTLFRALLLAEFSEAPLRDSYYRAHRLEGLRVADPFMGGGTPLLEANRLGCDVQGWDVNPMAYWIVRQEIAHLNLDEYEAIALKIGRRLQKALGHLYRTRCMICARDDADVKYFVWVKTQKCETCRAPVDLFPGYILAHAGRHPRHVLICSRCGQLSEVAGLDDLGNCGECRTALRIDGPARRNRCLCSACDRESRYPTASDGPPSHRLVAIEYHCSTCKPGHRGRFFKRPDPDDLARVHSADSTLAGCKPVIVPDDAIPVGDESARLHRWGYGQYRQMFNARQLVALEALGRLIVAVSERRVRDALATNLSDLLRYQNMLCRYDTKALKSLDIFSVHGFPVGLIQCESNFLGIQRDGSRTNVGSGGWSNIVEKFLRAKQYCERPFEMRYEGSRKITVPVSGEWIGDRQDGHVGQARIVEVIAGSSTQAGVADHSVDVVITDPPYFANVQYAELMDFCYVWLRRLLPDEEAFRPTSTRNLDELTGNRTLSRDLVHFTEGLAEVFCRMSRALKPGRPFVFTYHHNTIEAYYPIAVALLDAGLTCTASLPSPAEMGGSIHIHGTTSSIVDTVFVCRTTGRVGRRLLAENAEAIAELVAADLDLLRQGGVRVTRGDARCVAFGHLVRLATWRLRGTWSRSGATCAKLGTVGAAILELGGWKAVDRYLGDGSQLALRRTGGVREAAAVYDGESRDEVSF